MDIQINRVHFPVTVLGPGRRIGIWLQGCSIGCKGCLAHDTWPPDPSRSISISKLIARFDRIVDGSVHGVTISGGEPFDQAPALCALIDAVREWASARGFDIDVLCYSGYPFRALCVRHPQVLERLDAVIPEPFIQRRSTRLFLRGSGNQPLVLLSPLGWQRMQKYVSTQAEGTGNLQLAVDDGRLWVIGVPGPGDLEKVEEALAKSGIVRAKVSWQG